MREEQVEWGCGCGRLCAADDDACEHCDAPRSSGEPLRTLSARNKFLKKTEKVDRRALEGAKKRFVEVDESFRATRDEFDRHAFPELRTTGVVARDGMGLAIFGDELYADAFDGFYADNDDFGPWTWG
jgi:hypothetical protein